MSDEATPTLYNCPILVVPLDVVLPPEHAIIRAVVGLMCNMEADDVSTYIGVLRNASYDSEEERDANLRVLETILEIVQEVDLMRKRLGGPGTTQHP